MDAYTLAFYSLSAGLCFCLGMLLVAYAQLQHGTLMVRSTAFTMLALALAFFFSGHGDILPTWTTRIGTNMLLLFASVVLYSGFVAYQEDRPPHLDYLGTFLVGLTFLPFYWWGLVVPNGQIRSVIFSALMALLNARTTKCLVCLARVNGGIPAKLLAGLFGIGSLWMASRAFLLLLADPLPVAQKGSNPTTWITVFWFNVLVSAIVATLLAMEHRRATSNARLRSKGLDRSRSNLLLLWTMVTVITLTILTQVGIAYTVVYQRETRELQTRSHLANQTFVEYTEQIISQVDLLIHASRNLVNRKSTTADLEAFVREFKFPRDFIENIYVIGADGNVLVPGADRVIEQNVSQHLMFHQKVVGDPLFISPFSVSQFPRKHLFSLSRRLTGSNGQFFGVLLVLLEPKSLHLHLERMLPTDDAVATLFSSHDHKILALIPTANDPASYTQPMEHTQLWSSLAEAPSGSYRNFSQVGGHERYYHYQRVGDTSLVMVTGVSLSDIHRRTWQSIQPIGLGALLALVLLLLLAGILDGVIRKRDEQETFIVMLSHELKTPLSVIRMSLSNSNMNPQGAARILRAVKEIHGVIDRSLQADQLRYGLIDTHVEPFDPADLLQEIADAVDVTDRLQLNIGPLSPCNGDRQLLRAVIGNLIDNAVKYGHPERPILLDALAASRRKRPGITVRVSNSVGLAGFPDPQKIFRKYYRAHNAYGKTGSGLGLYIAEGFARMMGGKLTYLPGKTDVCFELWIPCA